MIHTPFNNRKVIKMDPALLVAKQMATNARERKTLAVASTVVLLASFAGMVTSSYTADHIKRSSCDMTKDEKLQKAYTWAWSSAVLAAGVTVAAGVVFAATVLKKKSA
jgi:hypothetical protein